MHSTERCRFTNKLYVRCKSRGVFDEKPRVGQRLNLLHEIIAMRHRVLKVQCRPRVSTMEADQGDHFNRWLTTKVPCGLMQ